MGRYKLKDAEMHNSRMVEPPGRPLIEYPPEEPDPVTRCDLCLGPYQQGKAHDCNQSAREENLRLMMINSPPNVRERVAAGELRNFLEGDGATPQ